MEMSRRPHTKQASTLTVYDELLLASPSFAKGKETLEEKRCVDARISSLRVSRVYPAAAYGGGSLRRMAGAWKGSTVTPTEPCRARASALQAGRYYSVSTPRKWLVSGDMTKFRSQWVSQNSKVLN